MLRYFYQCALRLHPARFRRRFGGEMLSIFDHQSGKIAKTLLLLDSLFSVARQWTLRPEFRTDIAVTSAPQPIAAGVPSFSTLDPFRPRTSAVIHGLVLSITLFCVTCFAIRYSWIHVLHVHIPAVAFDSYLAFPPTASPSDLRGASASPPKQQAKPLAASKESGLISPHLQVDVMPVEAETPSVSAIRHDSSGLNVSRARPEGLAIPLELSIAPFLGTYVSKSPRLTISISIQDESLTMRINGQSQNALLPFSTTRFFVEGSEDSWVEFISDSNGRVQQLELIRNGQVVKAKRQ